MSYRSTIARQPEALASTYATARIELDGIDASKLNAPVMAITGIGASYAAAVVAANEMQARGRRAFPVRASDLAEAPGLADVIIGLSHRGRSVETLAALANASEASRLAITNDPQSPLALAADMHLRLDNGSDATPSSTGYTATLLAAGMALDKAIGNPVDSWQKLPELVDDVLAATAARMDRIGALFETRRAIDCVGSGAALGTADEASLLVREAARIPTSSYDTRHFLHGPMESMDASTGVVVFGAGREIELARHLDRIGCPTVLVTTDPSVEDGEKLTIVRVPSLDNRIAQGIIDILVPQLLAAQLSDAAGLTDTQFRYRMSDTKVPQPDAV